MPTINEVWEQALLINANLGTLHNDQVDLKGCCAATNAALATTNATLGEVRSVLGDGLASVSAGLASMHQRQDLTNAILAHQARLLETVICAIEHVSRNTCELLNHADRQTRSQEALIEAVEGIEHMLASASPDSALALARERAHAAEIERCCPPPPPEPPCGYAPCERPKPLQADRPAVYERFIPSPRDG